MKRYSQRHSQGIVNELNVTPLLDLAFTLLIIFMITTPLMEQSIDLNLPEAAPQQPQQVDPDDVLQVSVNGTGQIFVNKQPVSLRELELSLNEFKQKHSQGAVYLRADADLRYQILVSVLDLVRASGLKLGLATQPDSQ